MLSRLSRIFASGLMLALLCGVASATTTGSISGHVYGPDGQPLEGIAVFGQCPSAGFSEVTYTDASGAYFMPNLYGECFVGFCTRENQFVRSTYNTDHDPDLAADAYPHAIEVGPGAAVTGIDMTLRVGAILTGVVTSANTGLPIPGAQVHVEGPEDIIEVTADSNGRYVAGGLRSGTYDVWLSAPGYAPTQNLDVATLTVGSTTEYSAAVEACGRIIGWVYDTDGRPVEGLCVNATGGVYEYTDSTGKFVLELIPGTRPLAFETSIYNLTHYPDLKDASYPVSIQVVSGVDYVCDDTVLDRWGAIVGHVYGPDGEPIQYADVRVLRTGSWSWYSCWTDATGAYSYERAAAGEYSISVNTSQHNTASARGVRSVRGMSLPDPVTVEEGKETALDDIFLEACYLGGYVDSYDGGSLEGISVCLSRDGERYETSTGEYGDYWFEDLSEGWFDITFDASEYNESTDPDLLTFHGRVYIDDSGAEQRDFNATLQPGGSLSGCVTGPDGEGLEGVRVFVHGYTGEAETLTDRFGEFQITCLRPGEFEIDFDPSAYNLTHDPDLLADTYPDLIWVEALEDSGGIEYSLEQVPPPPPPVQRVSVHRFYNAKTGSHFYTPSDAERDMVISRFSSVYQYEGVAYTINPTTNRQPLYRFYNRANGSHFYTASAAEADAVLAKWPDVFTYDGPTYSVTPTKVPGATAVHRFYRNSNGSHFYTASEQEATRVKTRYPRVYTYEGIAFWLSP